MKTIEIDDDLFAEIDKRATDLFSHSDVLKKLLRFAPSPVVVASDAGDKASVAEASELVDYVRGADYRRLYKGVDKYLAILSSLYKIHGQEFVKALEKYKRGKRVYFARTEAEIQDGANGNIQAKRIEGSPFWAFTTLDNNTKGDILRSLLIALKYTGPEIQIILATIPDSTSRKRDLSLYD